MWSVVVSVTKKSFYMGFICYVIQNEDGKIFKFRLYRNEMRKSRFSWRCFHLL